MSKLRTTGTTFTIDRSGVRTNSDGSITVPGNLTKTGVFSYQRGDETIRELRSDEEVFSQDALDSLEGVAVTVDHPPDFLTLDNLEEYQVGRVTHVAAQPPYVFGRMRIWGEEAVHMVKQGYLKEVSCGYACKPVEVTDSDEWDVSQTQLDYNHAALGTEGWGRLGSDVSLRLDSNGQEVITPIKAINTKDNTMDDINEALAPVLDAIKGLEAKYTSLTETLDSKAKEEPKEVPAAKEPEELPDGDRVLQMVQEKVDSILTLELEARDAYQAFFPDNHVEPKLCGQRLCEAVLQTIDSSRVIEDGAELEPLVREAQLLAKKERLDTLAGKQTVQSIQEQLSGVKAHVLQTPKSPIRAHIFGNNEG